MATTVKQMLEAANAAVPKITPAQAKEMIAKDNTLVVDVRDGTEVAASGKVAGAVHVSRGMLEFRADPESPYHDKNFAKDKDVILYCASGGRSALAGKLLKDLGYEKVFNLGGFKDWADSGGAVENNSHTLAQEISSRSRASRSSPCSANTSATEAMLTFDPGDAAFGKDAAKDVLHGGNGGADGVIAADDQPDFVKAAMSANESRG